MSVTTRTFIVYVQDKPGVLNRVISLIRRRNYNIDSLMVGRTERAEISRITLVLRADDGVARRLEANLYKLVNVLHVQDVSQLSAVVRELLLIKVDDRRRAELLPLCEVFRARVVNLAPGSVTLEATGDPEKIDGLIAVLNQFGILEMVRTGSVAMTRNGEAEVEQALAEAGPRGDPLAA